MQIHRIEAAAEGVPMNAHDYGLVNINLGVEDALAIGKVPNMRLLDAGKKGLDAMIEAEKNPLTVKLTEMGRALSKRKTSYLN